MHVIAYCPVHQDMVRIEVVANPDGSEMFTCYKHRQFSHTVRITTSRKESP